jgi:hypothetical protein
VNVLFASYSGLPIRGSQYFGAADYYETAAYVGVIVVVLAALAVVLRYRDHIVLSLSAVCVVCLMLTYSTHVSTFLDGIPAVQNLQWTRALTALDFGLCVLAGFGMQSLLDRHGERITRRAFPGLVAAMAVLIGVLWIRQTSSHMPSLPNHIRNQSFVWPAVDMLMLVVTAILLFGSALPIHLGSDRSRLAVTPLTFGALLLFAGQVAFLLTATPHLWSSSSSFFPATPAEATLQRDVGQARVGFAACPSILSLPNLGILTEANDVYQVSEASAYDGTVPKSYFTSYFEAVNQKVPSDTGFGQFCPSMTSASIARHFGIGYVLSQAGAQQPAGMTLVETISGEDLYSVPGGGVVTVAPDTAPAEVPTALVTRNLSTDPSEWRVVVNPSVASTMYVHITNFPGWTATIDGRPLPLRQWGGTMMAAAIPSGRHAIVISYAPSLFKVGTVLAMAVSLSLLGAVWWSFLRQRRSVDHVPGAP